MVPLFRPPLAPPDSGGESGSSSQGRLGGGLNDLVYGLRPADALILTKSYILEIAAFPDKYRGKRRFLHITNYILLFLLSSLPVFSLEKMSEKFGRSAGMS